MPLTHHLCRFCKSVLKELQDYRHAFCNSECSRLYKDYGSIPAWKEGRIKQPKGNRKTQRKNKPSHTREGGKLKQPPLKRVTDSDTYGLPLLVEHTNGEVLQLTLFTLYPKDCPPILTGGAIPTKKEPK